MVYISFLHISIPIQSSKDDNCSGPIYMSNHVFSTLASSSTINNNTHNITIIHRKNTTNMLAATVAWKDKNSSKNSSTATMA